MIENIQYENLPLLNMEKNRLILRDDAEELIEEELLSEHLISQDAKVVAVCIGEKKGTIKHPVDIITLKVEHGIIGDAHAGNWHRQVSLLANESVDKMREIFPDIPVGAFAENILTEGIEVCKLPIDTILQIGEVTLKVTQIGKECHSDCAIRKQVGDCVMPREGIFAIVLKEGVIRSGDRISIVNYGNQMK